MDERIHSVVMEKREHTSMTGVDEVISFSDEAVMLRVADEKLCIKGINLHIDRFSADSGDIEISGRIIGMMYSGAQNKSVKGRLFK